MTPRPYQIQAHAKVRETWEAYPDRGALLVMATGTGKTITGLSLAVSDFLSQGARVVWLAHREELLNQPMRNMAQLWPEHKAGVVQADRHVPDAQIVFASVATLAMSPHRAAEIVEAGQPALVVIDEAHHATAPTHQAAIEAIGAPLRLGLTATPHRDDGADLSEDWEIAFSYDIAKAIRGGFLVTPYARVARLPELKLDEVAGRWDYDEAALGAELLRAGVVDHTVRMLEEVAEYAPIPAELAEQTGAGPVQSSAKGRSALVFTATVEQARLTAEAMTAAGWRARHISGQTGTHDRRRLLRAFEAGRIDALCNASLLTEGTDLPRASAVVLARPTRSWSLFVQMLGRGLRLDEASGKRDCLILDLAGATEDHSLISAPVLIGGSPCPKSPDNAHAFERRDDGSGRCEHCNKRVACFEALAGHAWNDEHRCGACGVAQCPDSPTDGHHWMAIAGFKRRCLYCAVEVPDPLAGMVGRRREPPSRPADAAEGDWVRLRGVTPAAAAVDVGEHGLLFVTWEVDAAGAPVGDKRRVWWLPYRARIARAIPDEEPVPRSWVRALAHDLISRSEKVAARAGGGRGGRASWKHAPRPTAKAQRYGERYGVFWQGETAGDYARRVLAVKARERAIAVGICAESRGVRSY